MSELWKEWDKTRSDEALTGLYKQYNGMIQSAVNKYVNPNIPRAAIEGEAKNQAFIAFNTYNPKKAQLSTHVGTRLQKLYSYVSKYQNVGKIPEGEISSINTYKQAKEMLRTKLGREPSTAEMADEMSWPIKRIAKMETSLRGDYIDTGLITRIEADPNYDRMMLTYYEMTPEEQNVFDYITGSHGKPKLSPGDVARTLNISNSKVSAVKNKIATRMAKYAI